MPVDTIPGFVVENRAAAERGRDRVFMRNDCLKVGYWFSGVFNRPNKALEALKAVKLFPIAYFGLIDRGAENAFVDRSWLRDRNQRMSLERDDLIPR